MKNISNRIASAFILLLSLVSFCSIHADTGRFRLADGGELYWEDYGEGTPVIFIHGHTLDHRMWRQQIEPFSKDYHVILLDMRGYGLSSKQYDGLCRPHVDDIIEYMDSMHIGQAHVVGLSMGGMIAADMVSMYPERMLSATMASGVLSTNYGPSTPFTAAEKAARAKKRKEVLAIGLQRWRKNWVNRLVRGGGSHAESIRQELQEQVDDWDGFQLLEGWRRAYYAQEALRQLQKKRPALPTLFLSGVNEKWRRPTMMQYLPNSRYVIIQDCGHMTNMEQPEEFNSLVLDFIKNCK